MPTPGKQHSENDRDTQKAAEFIELVRKKIEMLRPKLLDLTRRNPLLAAPVSLRSNALVRAVDELPDALLTKLNEGVTLQIVPLPPLSADPKDEQTRAFQDALENARLTDPAYLEALDKASDGSDASSEALARAERDLKDRLRDTFDLPKRQTAGNPSLAQHARNNGIAPSYDLPSEKHSDGRHEDNRIQTLLLPDVLERRSNGLMGKQRTWEQETGINVLQIAFGFLEWTDTNSDVKNLAPLVLMPVKLNKSKTSRGPEFYVESLGDKIESNRVLHEKCLAEHDIKLPEYHDGTVESFLDKIAKALPRDTTWKVRRQVAVGVFPSARLAMYYDLDTSKGVFDGHSIVEQLLAGTDVDATALPFAEDYEVDRIDIEKKVPFLVRSADASQFSTLVDVADGKNLAIEGPPGTGKSQTIVNAIAAAMAAGKKVLFVAEKTAALDVVRSRLDAVKLGEFLLPLLANRSSKEKVIEAIRRRTEMKATPPIDYERKVAALRARKQSLAEYIDVMASPFRATGLTVHKVLGKAIRTEPIFRELDQTLQKLPIQLDRSIDRGWFAATQSKAKELENGWKAAKEADPVWQGVAVAHLDPFKVEKIVDAAMQAANSIKDLLHHRTQLGVYGFATAMPAKELDHVIAELDKVTKWEAAQHDVLRQLATQDCLKEIEDFVAKCRTITATLQELTALLDDPLAEHWPATLEKLVTLARELKLERVSDVILQQKVNKAATDLENAAVVSRAFKAFVECIPAARKWQRQVLKELAKLAHTTPPEVYALRNRKLLEAYNLAALKAGIADLEDLLASRARLNEAFELQEVPTPATVFMHLGQIKNAHVFSFLFKPYREAKRYYIQLSKAGKFDRVQAVEHLTALGVWANKALKFAGAKDLCELLGPHFKGLDTEVNSLRQLHAFYMGINASFSPLSDKEQIDLLHTATHHELRLLPAAESPAHTQESFETIQEASDRLAELEGALPILRAKVEEIAALCRMLKGHNDFSIKSLKGICEQLPAIQKTYAQLTSHSVAARALGALFQGIDTHKIPGVAENIAIAVKLSRLPEQTRDAVIAAIGTATVQQMRNTLVAVTLCYGRVTNDLKDLKKVCGIEFCTVTIDTDWAEVESRLRLAARDNAGLFAHSHMYTLMESIKGDPLSDIAEKLIGTNDGLARIGEIGEALIARSLAKDVYGEYGKVLSKLSGTELHKLRREIAALDKEIIEITQAHIQAKIRTGSHPPSGNGKGAKSTWTEYSLINNELDKKKRYIPLRDLTARSGTALLELMPCWMMSPLAVAQFIPDNMMFDLVVIDEASQMTPEDALGAIRRGRQVMIVGDTNQLPPTQFFKKLLDQEDENQDELVVEESILDLANSAFRPKRRLRWHYRSHDSSLIQFSNEYIYDRSLVFFPSPTEGRPDMGVKFMKVDGLYANGTNPIEARTIVNHALQFMKRFPDRSLGIVTMNQKQQQLIEAEMNEALSRDSKASEYVSRWSTQNDGLEYFFIKNLENVQGDERDAIFIGTVYGPAATGARVAQKFGPINGVAGKRRLNVLFTRAKKLIVTFSSMNADDIRDEGSNAGVSLLRKWIEYSATGMLRPNIDTGREPDSDFELHVMDQLRSIGCEVVPQVGVEGYFIDIGVKHPTWPHGFVLGVECDGATYHSSKSARDRDRLRQEVLEDLGWTLYRIWSTDWFNDAMTETQKLKVFIEARLKKLQDSIIEMPAEFLEKKAPAKSIEPEDVKYEMRSPPDAITGVDQPKALFSMDDLGIQIGDQITVRYLDSPKQTRVFTLSDKRNDPGQGLVAVWEPLGDALQGAGVGDEVEFDVGGQMRSVRVEKIEKARVTA
ncbi:MAG: DUF4011 domain-containing protein [Alphaproteobacteria bacterium]